MLPLLPARSLLPLGAEAPRIAVWLELGPDVLPLKFPRLFSGVAFALPPPVVGP